MSSKQSVDAAKSGSSSIDAVIGTRIAKVAANLRPSWIGPRAPSRPVTPSGAIMPIPVTIEFASPGLQPPVFIATSMTDPPWEPLEMEGTQSDSSKEFRFSKTFSAQEGEYQYKLRLGPGDWWVCDESKPRVDDGQGNKNNLVRVKASNSQHDRADSVHEHEHEHDVPLMPHESHDPVPSSSFLQSEHYDGAPTSGAKHPAPFFRHESLVPDSPGEKDEEEPHSPLLRHESAVPTHEAASPLFRHESIAIDDQKHEDRNGTSPVARVRKHSGDPIPEEADPNEPGLEQFPTDHRGILDSIARTQNTLAEDETSHSHGSTSPGQAAAKRSSSLPKLTEDEEEQTKEVPKVQVIEPDNRPAAPMTPPMTPTKEKQVDPIAERGQDKVHAEKDHEKSLAERGSQEMGRSSFAAVLTGSMFAFAVALTAVGIWYFAESGKNMDFIET